MVLPVSFSITHIPFKMESIRDVVHMVKRGVWMASVDLHHAYNSVSIHAPHMPYLSFFWQGTYYHYLWLCTSSSSFYETTAVALWLFAEPGPFISGLYGRFLASRGLCLLL